MKKLLSFAVVAAFAFAAVSPAFAADEKKGKGSENAERTVRGKGVCAKCELGETDKCVNAIQVSRKNKDGKDINMTFYLADNQVSKDFHGELCKGSKMVMAKGTVKVEGKGKDAKRTLTASSIEVAKGGKGADKKGKGKGKGKDKSDS